MTTDVFALPELSESQSQKEVKHNEALRLVELVIACSVKDKDLSTPPGSPVAGDRYIVKTTGLTDWAGHDEDLAMFSGGDWIFIQPVDGTVVYVVDEQVYYRFNLTGAWEKLLGRRLTGTASSVNPASLPANSGLVFVTTVTVTGAVVGDMVRSVTHGDVSTANWDKVMWFGKVTAADTLSAFAANGHTAAVDLASATVTAIVAKA